MEKEKKINKDVEKILPILKNHIKKVSDLTSNYCLLDFFIDVGERIDGIAPTQLSLEM